MSNKLKHTPATIVNNAFHVDFKGYSPFEVDLFLDEIVQDYHMMQSLIKQYEAEIIQLHTNNRQFQEQLKQLESQLAMVKETPSNSDVLQRLARLESLINQKDWYLGNRWETRGKSMLAQSEMIVVFVLGEKITLGSFANGSEIT